MPKLSAPPPWDQRPNAFVNVVEDRLGQDLGEGHTACQRRASGDERRDDERVEASGCSPAHGLGNRSGMGLCGMDEIGESRPLPHQGLILAGTHRIDNAHADGVTGLAIDQDEAAGLAAIGITVG